MSEKEKTDLFEREQIIYDEAVESFNNCDCDDTNMTEQYKQLVDEYGKLLRQLRRVTKMNDHVERELKAGQLDLLDLVHYDQLTGVHSRVYMKENLERVTETAVLTKEPLSIFMVDIDFFKNYNDTYGHQQGDKCLKAIGKALNDSIKRREDFIARYGGEEFLVVLPNTDEYGAKTTAERILRNIRSCNIEHKSSSAAPIVTASIGVVTCFVEEGYKYTHYIEMADKALYASKLGGRNKYTFFQHEGEEK